MGLRIAHYKRYYFLLISAVLSMLTIGLVVSVVMRDSDAAVVSSDPLTGMSQLSAGSDHTCGLTEDGQAYCWGSNSSGRLGDGSQVSSPAPVAVDASGALAGKAISQIAVGADHTCVVADGAAYCWGYNEFGQIGDGTRTTRLSPVAVDTTGVLANKSISQIVPGNGFTCAVADGQAYCWGYGVSGKLGSGMFEDSNIPVAVDTSGALAGKTITQLSAGFGHACAIADGQAYCWGNGIYGSLGNGAEENQASPVAVDTTGALADKTVTQLTTGSSYTCVLADGNPYCWGYDGYGQLGDGGFSSNKLTPTAVITTGVLANKTVTQIVAKGANAGHHTCVLADGNPYCWGSGSNGQLGYDTSRSDQPVAINAGDGLSSKTISQLVAGGNHTCALTDDTLAYCWGYNWNGQIGNGSVKNDYNVGYTDAGFVAVAMSLVYAPEISQIYGNEVYIDDETATVEINGRDFDNVTVTIGGQSAEIIQQSSRLLRIKVPVSATAGSVDLVVTNQSGQSVTREDAVTYREYIPVISEVYPSEVLVNVAEGRVIIRGEGFDKTASVTIDGEPAKVIFRQGGSTLGVFAPVSATEKTVDITVTNGNGRTVTLESAIAYQAADLQVSGMETMLGGTEIPLNSSGVAMILEGIGFDDSVSVTIDGSPVEHLETVERYGVRAYMIFKAPARSSSGVVDVVVTRGDGQSVSVEGGLTYVAAPPQAHSDGPTKVNINATGARLMVVGYLLSDDVTVTIGGKPARIVERNNSFEGSSLVVEVPPSPSASSTDLTITNSDGQSATLEGAVEYVENAPLAVEHVQAETYVGATGVRAYLLGAVGFDDGTTVTIGGKPAKIIGLSAYVEGGIIQVEIPDSDTPGSVDMVVTNNRGQTVLLENAITYQESERAITGVTFGEEGDKKIMTINGIGLIASESTPEMAMYGLISVATLNDTPLPWCFDGIGYPSFYLEMIGYYKGGSGEPACYYLFGYGFEMMAASPNEIKIWLPDTFDVTAPGKVSIHGAGAFMFNQPPSTEEPIDPSQPIQETVQVGNKPLTGTPAIAKRPTFSGTATPGASVTVTVYSDPVSCTTTADEEGRWSCTLPQDLATGDHTVYVRIVNPDNSTQELGPYAVTVSAGDDTPPVVTSDTKGSLGAVDSDIGAPNSGMQQFRQAVASPEGIGAAAATVTILGVVGLSVYRIVRRKQTMASATRMRR